MGWEKGVSNLQARLIQNLESARVRRGGRRDWVKGGGREEGGGMFGRCRCFDKEARRVGFVS